MEMIHTCSYSCDRPDCIKAQRDELRAQLDGRKSFGQLHPANPAAKCKCEHWQSCAECHPTAHQPADVVATKSWIDPKDLKVVTEYIRANDFYKPQPAAVPDECIGGDPYCPCKDGELCHYKDAPDGSTKAMDTPQVTELKRQRDIAVAALEYYAEGGRGDSRTGLEALKEIGEIE
jgi:hypothetical protein